MNSKRATQVMFTGIQIVEQTNTTKYNELIIFAPDIVPTRTASNLLPFNKKNVNQMYPEAAKNIDITKNVITGSEALPHKLAERSGYNIIQNI